MGLSLEIVIKDHPLPLLHVRPKASKSRDGTLVKE
jgi:hypothetical protein